MIANGSSLKSYFKAAAEHKQLLGNIRVRLFILAKLNFRRPTVLITPLVFKPGLVITESVTDHDVRYDFQIEIALYRKNEPKPT
jgi:hypothetical protein